MNNQSPNLTVILGEHYRDKHTGFTGCATAFCQYLSRGPAVALEARVGADGKANECWVDATRLESVPATPPVAHPETGA